MASAKRNNELTISESKMHAPLEKTSESHGEARHNARQMRASATHAHTHIQTPVHFNLSLDSYLFFWCSSIGKRNLELEGAPRQRRIGDKVLQPISQTLIQERDRGRKNKRERGEYQREQAYRFDLIMKFLKTIPRLRSTARNKHCSSCGSDEMREGCSGSGAKQSKKGNRVTSTARKRAPTWSSRSCF